MVNPIPNFAKHVWSKWNIRGVILVSLSMQIFLIFVAPFRKRSRNAWLVLLLWFVYLAADVTANYCVGLISNKYGDKDSSIDTVKDYLLAFWTPFLLMHLGGPDTITAFSVEDNELWLRHMLQLIVQVILTGYVFLLTLPKNTLWIPTALVFVAGVIKFAERTRSLQLASLSNFRQSMIRPPDAGPNYAKLMEELNSRREAGLPTQIVTMPEISDEFMDIEPEPSGAKADHEHTNVASTKERDDPIDAINTSQQSQEKETPDSADKSLSKGVPNDGSAGAAAKHEEENHRKRHDAVKGNEEEKLLDVEVVKGAYDYFNTFKKLVVDMIFSFQELNISRTYLQDLTAVDALRVIEVELNFIYQAFYTKETTINNWLGLFFRVVSIVSVVAAFVVFIYDQKKGCDPFDIKVTYILLYGAVALDVVSIFMLLLSDHSFASIYSWVSQKVSDSDSGTGTDTRTSKLASIFSWVLKLYTPKWTQDEINKPEWFKNKRYSVLKRRLVFRRWSETISGYNLISFCLHKKKKWLDWVIDKIGAKEFVEQWKYEKKMPLLQRLWIFIFTELKRKSGDADDVETIQRICSSRGEWVIQEGELSRDDLNKLMHYVERNEVTFDQCLILWHIATDLLFYEEEDEMQEKKEGENKNDEQKKNKNTAQDLEQGIHGDDDDGANKSDFEDIELKHFSKVLSDYMLYLLIMQPTMMSAIRGIGQIRFQDTCAEATNFFSKREMIAPGERKMKQPSRTKTRSPTLKLKEFIHFIKKVLSSIRCGGIFFKNQGKDDEAGKSAEQKACNKLTGVRVEIEPSAVKGDRSKSLLFDACKLATVIKDLKGTNKWKLMAQVWVEILSYAATNCIPITHVRQLSKGGEFLSLIWLLMTHLGLAKQFQIKEGHARAKLVVTEDDQGN
ncbi:unnamed protein product [Sphenostylis stenocarpa]|uniref:DUF4220 domain-containing protein n=1 Tax=Sphenostylis stenocarpa TaxID=92480 RepID=A0AA86SPK5_9FABA|nr:unnamed protein product [Sphenostylis stenocarpa]